MKNVILFLGSLLFYAWGEPSGCVLLLASILLNYCLGLIIGQVKRERAVFPLAVAIVMNLGILAYFKYDSDVFPVGISIWTLQSLSYLISVYRGQVKPRKNILELGMYVALFPLAFVGPVVDYRDMEEQLGARKLTAVGVSTGLKRFCFGLAKKALLADGLAELWQSVRALNLSEISMLTAWVGIWAFCFEIYFTFSGFSDMGIGLMELCGFAVPENFDHPLVARSVTEFWEKWHISLGKWFRDYVYQPLCGKKENIALQLIACLLTMILVGAWYGTGVHFLLWGLWFGLFLCLEKLFLKKLLEGFVGPVGILYNLAVVLVGWVFFALERLQDILHYLMAMAGFGRIFDGQGFFLLQEYWMVLAAAAVCATPVFARIAKKLSGTGNGWDIALYRLGEKVIPPILLLLSIACIVDATVTPFLHFGW